MNESIQRLFDEWQRLQPLGSENHKRLWDKLRLEWNFNSNHIEGNTLSYGETELLLIHGQTTGTHTIREYEEMKAHDVAITHVEKMAESSSLITEGDIRDLNKIILKEPYWKPAQTESGQATQKQIIPGDYKSTPNNVRTATGEIFHFAPPIEVQPKMQELVQQIKNELESPTQSAIDFAALLHHNFVLIHPFDDGNGRVARLIANYILIKSGFPPIVVRSDEKANYLAALRLADSGEPQSLMKHFESLMEWSLDLAVRAAKGESVEEVSDVEKEIKFFIQRQNQSGPNVLKKENSSVHLLWKNGLEILIEKFVAKLKTLEPLFIQTLIRNPFTGQTDSNWKESFLMQYGQNSSAANFMLQFEFQGYKGSAEDPFNFNANISVNLQEFRCTITSSETSAPINKLYSEFILADEVDAFAIAALKSAFTKVKNMAGNK